MKNVADIRAVRVTKIKKVYLFGASCHKLSIKLACQRTCRRSREVSILKCFLYLESVATHRTPFALTFNIQPNPPVLTGYILPPPLAE